MTRSAAAYRRTVAVLFVLAIMAGIVEALAFTTPLFVPITWTIVDGGNAVALIPFLLAGLLGHFAPPRSTNAQEAVRAGAVLVLVGLAAAVAWTVYLPASAALAGYVCGSVYFMSGDRRKPVSLPASGATSNPHDENSLRCKEEA